MHLAYFQSAGLFWSYITALLRVPYDTYRDAMWVLVLLLFTVQGFAINDCKKITRNNQ